MTNRREPTTLVEACEDLGAAVDELRAAFMEPLLPYLTGYMDAMMGKHGVAWLIASWGLWAMAAFFLVFLLLMAIAGAILAL